MGALDAGARGYEASGQAGLLLVSESEKQRRRERGQRPDGSPDPWVWLIDPDGLGTSRVRQSMRPQCLARGFRDHEPEEVDAEGRFADGRERPENPAIARHAKASTNPEIIAAEGHPELFGEMDRRLEGVETGIGRMVDAVERLVARLEPDASTDPFQCAACGFRAKSDRGLKVHTTRSHPAA